MNNLKADYSANSYEQIAKKLSTIDKRIDMLYEDKADGRISLEFWEEKNRAWQKEKHKLSVELQSISKSNDTFIEGSNLMGFISDI